MNIWILFYSLLLSVMAITASVSKLSEDISYFGKKIIVYFIIYFCIGKYSFSLDKYSTNLVYSQQIDPLIHCTQKVQIIYTNW